MIGERFERLPQAVRQEAVRLLGWRNRIRRYGRGYKSWRKFLEDSADWTLQQREAWQQTELTKLVDSARTGTRYYADALSGIASARDPSARLDAILHEIPVLEKAVLRKRPSDFENRNVPELEVSWTSGSTGSPMRVGHCKVSLQRRFGFFSDHRSMVGVPAFWPSVRLSGRILCPVGKLQRSPWVFNSAENQLFLSSYHLDQRHSRRIAEKLRRFRPAIIDGYPSAIIQTLRLMRTSGVQLDGLAGIITTAETLQDEVRQEMVQLSGVPVMDYYSASEGLPFIQQCPHGTYHLRWQSGICEVDTGSGIYSDGDGELICTSFVQERTPLIRYRTGDLVQGLRRDPEKRCSCGLDTSTVERLLGRQEDLIYTPDGRALGMFTYRTLKFIEGLGDTQVIQHEYSRFEVNTTSFGGAREDALAERISESFERVLGYPVALRLNQVESLERGPNGKVRLVVSRVMGGRSGLD